VAEGASQIALARPGGAGDQDVVVVADPLAAGEEIADDLRSALAQIEDVLGDLEQRVGPGEGDRMTQGTD
jgi:hypothetical protein